jgi:hypothetical protein
MFLVLAATTVVVALGLIRRLFTAGHCRRDRAPARPPVPAAAVRDQSHDHSQSSRSMR